MINYKYGNWLHGIINHTIQHLKKYKNKDNLQFLEIGSAEGRSTNYFIDNYLQGDNSKITCIDPWILLSEAVEQENYKVEDNWCVPENEQYFYENTKHNKHKIIVYKGFSKNILPTLQKNYYDFVYVDGDHSENAVYNDAIMSLKLLKQNGIMSFDDAQKNYSDRVNVGPGGNIKKGIDRFLDEHKNDIQILCYNYQTVIKKIK